ncbi:MAG: DMT family transporter [Spirochaetaceae bacterium]|nr:MAG: DMT family transporter [Spirochaetaceae bacterium]
MVNGTADCGIAAGVQISLNRVPWAVQKSDAFKLVLVSFLWGGQFVAARIATAEAPPFAASFLRYLFAAVTLLIIHLIRERRFCRLSLRQWGWLTLLGLSGVFLYNLFFFSALAIAPAGRSSVVVAMTPTVVSVASIIFFKDRFSILRVLGLVIALFGVSWAISGGDLPSLLRGEIGRGDLYIFGAMLSWATFSIIGKIILRELSPRLAITYACLIGTVALAIPAVLEGGLAGIPQYSLKMWLSLAYLGLMGTVLAFILYYQGIKSIGPSKTAIFVNLVPIWAMSLGTVVLGERITLSLILGAGMVVGGVFLTSRS